MQWDKGIDYCLALSLAGYSDWRMPHVWELTTIVDYSTYKPAIDTLYFPDTRGHSLYPPYYHTRTLHGDCDSCSLRVDFYFGSASSGHKGTDHYVKCVRDD